MMLFLICGGTDRRSFHGTSVIYFTRGVKEECLHGSMNLSPLFFAVIYLFAKLKFNENICTFFEAFLTLIPKGHCFRSKSLFR